MTSNANWVSTDGITYVNTRSFPGFALRVSPALWGRRWDVMYADCDTIFLQTNFSRTVELAQEAAERWADENLP
jgi:hypothetical protein